MKFIHLFTCTFAAILILSITAAAQPGQGRGSMMTPEQRKAQMEKMAADLSLTEEQKTSYFKIEEDFSAKIQGLRTESQGDFTAMREGMTKLRQERDENVKAILNEEQWTKYQEIIASRQNRRGGAGQSRAEEVQEEKGPNPKDKERSKSKNKEKGKEKGGSGNR